MIWTCDLPVAVQRYASGFRLAVRRLATHMGMTAPLDVVNLVGG
jgi:hypothetical protein